MNGFVKIWIYKTEGIMHLAESINTSRRYASRDKYSDLNPCWHIAFKIFKGSNARKIY